MPQRRVVSALAVLALAVPSLALAPHVRATVTPGTPSQVAALVAAAPSIQQLPASLAPPLAKAANDQPSAYVPSVTACTTQNPSPPKCVYGYSGGKKTMVLFGDSHAYMWFPTLNAIAIALKWRLVVWTDLGCPVADTTVWNVATNSPDTGCPTWRTAVIKKINALNPQLVVMSEAAYTLNASHGTITNPQWTTDLEKSFAALHSKNMKKVLIGNTMLLPYPDACLASYPKAVQKCSIPLASTSATAERTAEQTAAKASKVPYVDEIPWTCSATCTAVIGNFVVYYSPGHLTTTYALYLTNVLRAALNPYL